MDLDHYMHLCLTLMVLILLYKQHRTQLRRLWQKHKAGKPRKWKPKSPCDCDGCRSGINLVALPDPKSVVPWSKCKSKRGRKKRLDTSGYACPHPDCRYFGIVDPLIHALVGYGWIDERAHDPQAALSGLPQNLQCAPGNALVLSQDSN